MLYELPGGLISKMSYRIAYGEAARLAEMARFDHGRGRDPESGQNLRSTMMNKFGSGKAGVPAGPGRLFWKHYKRAVQPRQPGRPPHR